MMSLQPSLRLALRSSQISTATTNHVAAHAHSAFVHTHLVERCVNGVVLAANDERSARLHLANHRSRLLGPGAAAQAVVGEEVRTPRDVRLAVPAETVPGTKPAMPAPESYGSTPIGQRRKAAL